MRRLPGDVLIVRRACPLYRRCAAQRKVHFPGGLVRCPLARGVCGRRGNAAWNEAERIVCQPLGFERVQLVQHVIRELFRGEAPARAFGIRVGRSARIDVRPVG